MSTKAPSQSGENPDRPVRAVVIARAVPRLRGQGGVSVGEGVPQRRRGVDVPAVDHGQQRRQRLGGLDAVGVRAVVCSEAVERVPERLDGAGRIEAARRARPRRGGVRWRWQACVLSVRPSGRAR